ncbi:uncharacterized protein LOC141815351 [Curcuma longa]|uniref:uncharacterized protein LOC141815351 n=1 Tax=Curcuma longa TaxID=136217 RepID=UPI003D9F4C5B
MESAPAGVSGRGYSDSVDSSPRASSSRLRVMCSYGGRILPRPTDKSLCYLGGQTRMVVVDRHASLADLSARLSRDLLGGAPFTLKYQLPNEDLDSLVSVATDEDLENMIDELDRIAGAPASSGNGSGSRRSACLRLFLFPAKLDSTPAFAIGSPIDESKSGTLFVDALDCAISGVGVEEITRGSTDSASINCLLGLDDGSSIHSRGVGGQSEPDRPILPRPDFSSRLGCHGQEVHSVPGSPVHDKASSFGSTSSTPLSNLPPIPVSTIDRTTEHQDDQFSHTNRSLDYASKQRVEEGFKDADHAAHPRHPPPLPLPIVSASSPVISPTENPNRDISDDDKTDRGGLRKPSERLIPPQNDNIPHDPDSRSMNSNPVNTSYFMSSPVTELPAYIMPRMHSEQLQRQHPHLHLQQQQPQFMPANSHYIHQTATGAVLSMPSYYPIAGHPMQQTPQVRSLDPQIPVFYMPVHDPTTPYNSAGAPPNLTDATAPARGIPTKPAVPASAYGTAPIAPSALQPQLVHVAANQSHPYAGTGYHVVQHPHLSQPPSTMANYSYEMPAATGHPQMVYSQAASQPALPRQYPTASSAAVIHRGRAAPGDSYPSKYNE